MHLISLFSESGVYYDCKYFILFPAGRSDKNAEHYEFESDDDDDVCDPDFKPSKYLYLHFWLWKTLVYLFWQ